MFTGLVSKEPEQKLPPRAQRKIKRLAPRLAA
jgi:hypothetical protein